MAGGQTAHTHSQYGVIFVFPAYPHVTMMGVSLQFIWQAKLTIATVQGPESKHL